MPRFLKGKRLVPAPSSEEIAAHIAEHGVTECPPCAAAVLGTSTPGWRHDIERSGDYVQRANFGRAKSQSFKSEAKSAHMVLAAQIGAPAYIEGHRAVFKKVRTAHRTGPEVRVYCRFFDKVCLIHLNDDDKSAAQAIADRMTQRYAGTGARFYVSREFIPTFCTWKDTVKPLILRAQARQAQQKAG